MSPQSVLPERIVNDIASDLATHPDLRLPAKLTQDGATPQEKHDYLSALLRHDPGVFLERHGDSLDVEQRSEFEPLREGSYEVDFYMKFLEDKQASANAPIQKAAVGATAKNRRLAKMARLTKEGFFEEEAARKRAPLLHHQYLGQYHSPQAAKPMPDTLHDQILEQHEERQIAEKMESEKKQEDIAGQAFELTLSESESDSDEDTQMDESDVAVITKPGHDLVSPDGEIKAAAISAEELQQNQEDFRAIMEARFLSGQDGGKDADENSSLDEDWAKEITQDKEDAYFDS